METSRIPADPEHEVQTVDDLPPEDVVVNVSSQGRNNTERILSNFADTPFTLGEKKFKSVESFWQGLYFPDEETRQEVASLDGKDAKIFSRKKRQADTVTYEGQEINIGSAEHLALMEKALEAKFQQNPAALNALINTGNKPIIHIVFSPDGKRRRESETIPGTSFAGMLIAIRNELRQKPK